MFAERRHGAFFVCERAVGRRVILSRDRFGALLGALAADGYTLVGPTVRDLITGVYKLPGRLLLVMDVAKATATDRDSD